jgi:hypothetical protein
VSHRIEEVARMIQLTRFCATCTAERTFEQMHAEPDSCPDVADGVCPEWGCSQCGDALFIGLPVPEEVAVAAAQAA